MTRIISKIIKTDRSLGVSFVFLFTLSVLFPILASVYNKNGEVLKAAGFMDVTIAIICFILFLLLSKYNAKQLDEPVNGKTRRIVEYVSTVPLLLIVIYFTGVKLNWAILLIGLGWRFWLFVMAVPYLVGIFKKK